MLISRKPCEISTKFLGHRVSLQSRYHNFQKNFQAAILNFQIFCKHKNAYISKTMRDRMISTKFLIHRVSLKSNYRNFQKKISLAKNGGHFEFSNFFAKLAKHKNAYIWKTVLDRAISTKFLAHRVSLKISHPNFQKNFVSREMASILNFSQTQKCLYLENRAR